MGVIKNNPPVATGVAGFDDIIGGGFTANRIYLIEGDPGSGKTTLALHFALEGRRRNERTLYVTLSETGEELRGVLESHGWSGDGLEIHELIPMQNRLLPDAQTRMFHPSEVELADTTRAIIEEIERLNPQRVVFDSLSELRMLAQNPLRYRRQILALKQFFSGRACTVLMLDDNTGSDGVTDLQLHSLAHGVVTMKHVAQDYGSERRNLRVLKLRGKPFRGGYHDFAIRRGGLEVFPRLVASEHEGEISGEPLKSGIPAFDALLGGGLDRGTSLLLMGPAGAGKSSFATRYVVSAAEQGEHATLFTFDENLSTLLARSAGLGMDLRKHYNAGRVRLQQVDPASLSPGEFAHVIRDSVETHKSRVVVIDSLNGYLNAMVEERFLTLHLHEMLTYLAQQGVVTVMVVAQSGLIGSTMNTPVDASYLADSVVLLRFFEERARIRRAVSVMKKRSGPHEESVREFRLKPGGIWVGEPLSQFHGVFSGVPQLLGAAEGSRLDGPGR